MNLSSVFFNKKKIKAVEKYWYNFERILKKKLNGKVYFDKFFRLELQFYLFKLDLTILHALLE